MPRRSRDSLGICFPNTPTASNSQTSLFFYGCELEEPLGEQPEIFEEPIREEEEEAITPTYTMVENRNGIENLNGVENKTKGAFPIRETNGDARIKNINPYSFPCFHSLTSEDPNTFFFHFIVTCELMIIPLMTRI